MPAPSLCPADGVVGCAGRAEGDLSWAGQHPAPSPAWLLGAGSVLGGLRSRR